MYRGLSSRGTKDRLSNSFESSFEDQRLNVSDILVPSYLNEESRRQRLKDNLNKMWQKSIEQAQKSEMIMKSSNSQADKSHFVSKVAELEDHRSRRRNRQTINYLESLKRRQIIASNGAADKEKHAAHQQFFTNADKVANRRAITANSSWHPASATPLHFMPRSTSRVLIEKMLPPSSKSHQRQIREKEMRKKTQSEYEFAEIEDSIKTILKKSDQRRPETTSMILQNMRDKKLETGMTLGPSAFAVPVNYTTSTGTSMLPDAAIDFLSNPKKMVQKRHKFIQSTPIVLTNSGCQTDPIEPVIVASKQIEKVDVADQTKPINMSSDNSSDSATKADNLNATGEGDPVIAVVQIAEEDSSGKKTKRQESGQLLLPRLGPATPADGIMSRPGTRGFKSNFSNMLKKKGSTPDRIESPLPPQLESNDQEIQQSPKPQMRPKSSSSDRLKVSKPKPQSPVVAEEEEGSDLEKSEDEDDENEVDHNDDDHQDQEDSPPSPLLTINNNRARTAPADIAPPKSILKKRPQFIRQVSYNSDGTGTPGYAKKYHKTKDFHIDPTLFRHFGEANTRRQSFSGISSSKSSKKPQQKKGVTYEDDHDTQKFEEEGLSHNISYYDEQSDYEQAPMPHNSQEPQLYYQNTYNYPYNNNQQTNWYQYENYDHGYYDPYLQQQYQYQQYPDYNYSYPTNPYPYYATSSDSQLISNQASYYANDQHDQQQQLQSLAENYPFPAPQHKQSNQTANKPVSNIYKPNVHNLPKKERIPVKRSFYVPPKKPTPPHYIPLSQTQPEEFIKQEPLFQPKPSKLRSHLSDNAIRVHAKDTLARNPRGKLRELYHGMQKILSAPIRARDDVSAHAPLLSALNKYMTGIDMHMLDSQEDPLNSADQSVESLVITANDEIQKSNSIPRTAHILSHPKEEESEKDDQEYAIEDLDLMTSAEITASVQESPPSLKATSADISDGRRNTRDEEQTSIKEEEYRNHDEEVEESGEEMRPTKRSSGHLSNNSKSSRRSNKQLETAAQQRSSQKSIDQSENDEEIRIMKKPGPLDEGKRGFSNNSNEKTQDIVRFSKSESSVISKEVASSTDLGYSVNFSAESFQQGSRNHAKEEAAVDDWPASKEIPKKSSSGSEKRLQVRLPPESEDDRAPKSRNRGKSDVGSMIGNHYRKPTGRKPPSNFIDALDLEEMGSERKSKIRRQPNDDSGLGSKEDVRSPPQQKSKKAKHRGRVEPDSEDFEESQDDNGYNSDGINSKHQKKRPSTQIYQQSNSSPPMIHNPIQQPNYQQMVMYGFRPQDQFQFQHQPYGTFMQPEFMMQQPVWNNQANPSQWMPVMTPQNYGYHPNQFFSSNQQAPIVPSASIVPIVPASMSAGVPGPLPTATPMIPASMPTSLVDVEKELVKSVPLLENIESQQVLVPKPPTSSPPPKAKSPRKPESVGLAADTVELLNPVSAILAELPDPQQLQQLRLDAAAPTSDPVEKNEKEVKRSSPNLINEVTAVAEELLPATVNTSNAAATIPSTQLSITQEPISAIRQNVSAPPIPYIVSQEVEQQRLAAMHALGILNTDEHPRLTKITQMTSRLLGRSCCVLSLVDTDKVIWKSVSPPVTTVREEPRYDSFCSWVVQDESGRGITVLDSKTDPRCSHIRVKSGLEFYAGVPILVGGKYKVGALSIQGPPSAQISVIDMNILHEMAVWASGELDTIMLQKTLQDRETFIQARDRLGELAVASKSSDKPTDSRSMEKSLGIIRAALKANCVLLLKIVPDSKGFQSNLQAYSFDPNVPKTGNLLVGDEMFHELCAMTLKKENGGESSLLLENLKTGPVTKEVDHYLSKKINKCISELLWSVAGPTAVIATFFDDTYRAITKEELSFMKSIVPTLSSIFDSLELKDSFQQASNISKNIGVSLKKQSVVFGKQQGLAPCIVMIEPLLDRFKGYDSIGSAHELEILSLPQAAATDAARLDTSTTIGGGVPKGQAVGQVIAQKIENDPSSIFAPEPRISETSKKAVELLPADAFDILNDFSQLIDLLADKFSLKRPKKIGLHYYLFANYGQETGSLANAASFAHEIIFAIDTYNQNKRRKLKSRIGIHLDFFPADAAQDPSVLKDQLLSLVNGAYQLETKADSILASELFYHQTKQYCSYEASGYPIVVRGQGAFSTYRLIGISQQEVLQSTEPVLAKENGVNNGASLITSVVPSLAVPLGPVAVAPEEGKAETVRTVTLPSNVIPATSPPKQSPTATPVKKFKCSIM